MMYRECEYCHATLDAGEICDCRKTEPEETEKEADDG